jgi:8-oxo-dGTP pyrophosphatase MutT (NUDIX family)
MKKWKESHSEFKYKSIIFKHHVKTRQSPDGKVEGNFDVLEMRDWVNVLAFNREGEAILVVQYRHGLDDLTLEVPAGVVDPGEDFLEAAKRELKEETGHVSEDWSYLGEVKPNPAFLTNTCKMYLAKNCIKKHEQSLDTLEDVEVKIISKKKLLDMVKNSEIQHSLTLSTLLLYITSMNESDIL